MDNQNKKYCLNCNDCVAVCPRDAIYKEDAEDIGVEGNILARDLSCNPEQFINLLLNIRPVHNFAPQVLTPQEKEFIAHLASLAPRNGFDDETRNTGIILVENQELLADIEQYTYHYLSALKKKMTSVWQAIPNLFNATLRGNIKATLSQINLILDAHQNKIDLLTYHAPSLLILHALQNSREAGENLTVMGYQMMLGAEVQNLGLCFLSWVSAGLQSMMMKRSNELESIYRRLKIPKNREIRSVLAIGERQVNYRKQKDMEKEITAITIL
jgi:ferredoxin